MESTPLMYRTLKKVLHSHQNWLDLRHLKTLAWMLNGLILSERVSLNAWAIYVHSRAHYLASSVRRFRRLLDNKRIQVHHLYAPLLAQALQGWHGQTIFVALDTFNAVELLLHHPLVCHLSRTRDSNRLESPRT